MLLFCTKRKGRARPFGRPQPRLGRAL